MSTCHYCGTPVETGDRYTVDSDGGIRCEDHQEGIDTVSDAAHALYEACARRRQLAVQVREADGAVRAAREWLRRAAEDAGLIVRPCPEGGD